MAETYISVKTKTAVLVLLFMALVIKESNARPPWLSPDSGVFTESAECHTDDELLDLCQRCAKLTKSKLAYPACCSTDLMARKWCSDYVYFGRGQYDFYLI
ncbi:uncharacterized protein LOC116775648 [Danaus plexippus]|uniref:uncharacterized protein LOC116775648 n=1 Tax=Danaus plexippus TaxID=13037 RepID=UPI002AB2E34E|nr:uncharacterized protein LOC116775648 [Danaus plexippus]